MAFKSRPKEVANQCMSDDDAYKMWVELRALHASLMDTRLRDQIQNMQHKVQFQKHQYRAITSHAIQSLKKQYWKIWVEERIKLNVLQNMMNSMTKYYHTTLQKMNTKYPNYRFQERQVTLPLLSEDGDIECERSIQHELLIYGYCRYACERVPLEVVAIIGSFVAHVFGTSFEHRFVEGNGEYFDNGKCYCDHVRLHCNDLEFQFGYQQSRSIVNSSENFRSLHLNISTFPEYILECTLLSEVSFNGRLKDGKVKNYSQEMDICPTIFPNSEEPIVKCHLKILRIKYKNGNVRYNVSTKMKSRFMYNLVWNPRPNRVVRLDNNNWCLSLDHNSWQQSLCLQLICLQLPCNVNMIGVKWGIECKGLKNEKILYFSRNNFIFENINSYESLLKNCHIISDSLIMCDFYSGCTRLLSDVAIRIMISVRILTVFDEQGEYIPAQNWEKYGIVD